MLRKLGITAVNLIKMDIEGAEVEALKGMEKTLNNSKCDIAFESHITDKKESYEWINPHLEQNGFKVTTKEMGGRALWFMPERTGEQQMLTSKGEGKSCLLVLLGDCREDYINPDLMPFLHHLRSKGSYASLNLAASFYAPAELFTGKSHLKTDSFFDFCFDPKNSPFRFFRFIRFPVSLRYKTIRQEIMLRKIVNYFYYIFTKNQIEFPRNIPFSLLPYFSVNNSKTRLLEHLYKIFEKEEFSFKYVALGMQGIEKETKKYKESSKGKNFVLLLHYGEPDKFGHKYGPSSWQMKSILKEVDASVKRTYELMADEIDFIAVFGAHEMEEIKENIDLWEKLKKLDSKMPRDYITFLNSPVARFWFKNNSAKREVSALLNSLAEYGRIVTSDELLERGFPTDEKYGEIIFWLRKGVNISPDFYHEIPIKGMHLYFDYPTTTPLFILHKDKDITLKSNGKLTDLLPTIFSLLNIQDVSMEGRSLIDER